MGPDSAGENPHILVVDDEPDTRDGCQHILSRMGYPVLTASRGADALQIVEAEPIAIVLLDLKMAGMDGMEVLRRIRQRRGDILVIVITGFATVETAIEAMKSGAYDFIAKPFDPDGLRIVVRRAHERIRLISEAERLERERRATLTDLLTEKSRIRTVVESLPTGVMVTNAEGRVVLANPALLQQLGLDPGRPPGEPIEAYAADEGFRRLAHQIAQGRGTSSEEVPACEFSPGGGRYLLARGRPIVGDGGESLGAVITVADISGLRALDRLKSEFVAEVSHELRSPLSTIHEQLAMAVRDLAEGNAVGGLPILSRALGKTHELISLVGDLLDLSRIESGTAWQAAKLVPVETVLSSVVSFLGSKAAKRRQSLTLQLPQGPPPLLMADPLALESIFGNLVTNAIHYTPEGGCIRVELRLRPGQAGPAQVEVAVIDNGMGIEAEDLGRIFERFFRVRNEKTRHIPGTGLGLPIVKGLVDALGGTIEARSSPGQGSTFTVVLPAAEEARPFPAEPAP